MRIIVRLTLTSIMTTVAMTTISLGESGFIKKEITLDEETYRYQVFVPDNWSPSKSWPVILFLHGAGERGSDGIQQTEIGLGPAIMKNKAAYPAVVLFPQCRRGVWWSEPEMETMVLKILDLSIQQFSGDPSRIYLTGLSMGGYGTFYFGSKYPDRFAALVPVCGGALVPHESRSYRPETEESPYQSVAETIKSKPIWIFHGAADPVVPVAESRRMKEALERLGVKVKYTEYPGVGHNSWDRAYSETDFPIWLLRQK